MRERFAPYVIAAAILVFAGFIVGWYAPRGSGGIPEPVIWRPDALPVTCALEHDGRIGFCLTDSQLASAATPSPRATP